MNRWRMAGRMRCWLFAVLTMLLSAAAPAADEDALQDLWKRHLAAGEDHDAAIQACQAFAAAHPGDPFLPVARGLAEWHLLRAGRKSEVRQMLLADAAAAPAGPVQEGARRLALGWLTRLDREAVAAALQSYYRKQVGYPKSLDQMIAYLKLPPEARPPMADRFGQPWQYALTGFAKLKGLTDQKYSLQSTALGDTSDLNTALQLPYASRLRATPVQMLTLAGNAPAVKFSLPGASSAAVVGVGQAAGELYLAFAGEHLLLVCDYTHWKLLNRP